MPVPSIYRREMLRLTNYTHYSYTAQCPHLASQHTIEIEYAEISMSRNLKPGYKKMGYDCKYDSECLHKDSYNRCLVFVNAPQDPNLL